MARVVFITLALLGITILGFHLTHGSMYEHVQLHMEQLSRDMVQLLDSMEKWNQWQNWATQGALALASLQHWQIWAFPGVFILFFGTMWCIRKTKYLTGSSSRIWICAAILALFLKTFIFFMKVAWMVFINLVLLEIIRLGIHLTCCDIHDHVQLHMEQLSRNMAQLLDSMVNWNQWRNWAAQGALVLASLQRWMIWALPGVLILLFGIIWCIRKRKYLPGSSGIIWVHAAILAAFPKAFIFVMKASRMIFITLALLGIIRLGIHLTCGNTHEHVHLHMEQLRWDMAQLLDIMMQGSPWQNWVAQGAMRIASLRHWQIWAILGVLILWLGLILCIRKTKYFPRNSSIIMICAAILIVFVKTFVFFVRGAQMAFMTLAFKEIIRLAIHLMRGDIHEQVQLRMEQLSRNMAQLLDSMVNWNQWRNWAAQGALVLASLQRWQIWAFPGVFILFFGTMWCIRKTKYLTGSSSITWICAAILAVVLKTFIFAMKVAWMVFINLVVLGIIRLGIHLTCGNTHEHVHLHMEQLRWDMAQLLDIMVQRSQWRNCAAQGAMRIASLRHWQIWAILGVLILWLGLILCIRKTKYFPRNSSIIMICAAILIVFVKTFVFFVRGAQMAFMTLAFKEIIRLAIHLMRGDIHEQVQLRMEQLSRNMAQLLDSMVQRSQWQNWVAKGALLLPALQYWKICTFPGVFILFFGLIWCIRQTKYLPGSSSITWICAAILAAFLKPYFLFTKMAEIWRSRNKEDDNEEEEESDSDKTRELGRVRADSIEWPAPYMADNCQLVEELVDDLLRICRGQTCHSFTPRLQPPTGVCVYEEWSSHSDNVIYRLIVPMKALPGHTFHVELDDVEETATSNSCLRVQLQCSCTRERMLGDMLCFLHHNQEELRGKQEPSLLDTFCTGSYLDVEKSMLWLQDQVKAAWRRLPQSRDCLLELLPSSHSCKIRLTAPSDSIFNIEMTLGVLLDESGTFLSIE